MTHKEKVQQRIQPLIMKELHPQETIQIAVMIQLPLLIHWRITTQQKMLLVIDGTTEDQGGENGDTTSLGGTTGDVGNTSTPNEISETYNLFIN